MTAAYMTRCVYLTFFGEYRRPRRTRTSRRTSITVPADHPRRVRRRRRLRSTCSAWPFRRREVRASASSRACAFPAIVHAEFDYAVGCDLARGRHRSASASRAYFWYQHEELGRCTASPSATALARAGYTFLVNKYYLDVLYERHHRRRHQGPDRHGRRTGSTSTSSTTSSTAPARGARALGRFTYDVHRPEGRRRRSSTARPTVTGEAGGRAPHAPDPAGSSATRCCCSRRWRSSPASCCIVTLEPRGIDSMNWFDSLGADPGGLPPASSAWRSCCSIPQAEEKPIKVVALLTTLADARRRRSRSSPTSTTTRRPACSSTSTSAGSTSSTAATTSASTASRCRCSLLSMFITRAVRHLLVEPLPRAAQPEGVPHPDPDPRDRA